jgi:hypothetical protein
MKYRTRYRMAHPTFYPSFHPSIFCPDFIGVAGRNWHFRAPPTALHPDFIGARWWGRSGIFAGIPSCTFLPAKMGGSPPLCGGQRNRFGYRVFLDPNRRISLPSDCATRLPQSCQDTRCSSVSDRTVRRVFVCRGRADALCREPCTRRYGAERR